jgi:hypothetical protein
LSLAQLQGNEKAKKIRKVKIEKMPFLKDYGASLHCKKSGRSKLKKALFKGL